MNDDLNDDLDRALFALPLEPAPAGLRASILRATIHAPQAHALAPELAARPWELLLCGSALGVAAWLIIALATSHPLAALVANDAIAAVRAFGDQLTLEWVAVGVVATAAFWYAGDAAQRLPSRGANT